MFRAMEKYVSLIFKYIIYRNLTERNKHLHIQVIHVRQLLKKEKYKIHQVVRKNYSTPSRC